MLGSPVYIEAPPFVPAPGGLYSAATVRDGEVHVAASGTQYLAEICGVPQGLVDPVCIPEANREEKTFDRLDLVTGDPFVVYKGVECEDMHDDDTVWARRSLEASEHIAVEEGWMAIMANSSPTDLTPASGPVTVEQGVAILEGYAAANYGGTPVLHMSRMVTSLAASADALWHNAQFDMYTKQGALVANGGGYEINLAPGGGEAAAGTAWIYVTGAVVVTRAPVNAVRALGAGEGLNLQRALAERPVAVTGECILAAVNVDLFFGGA